VALHGAVRAPQHREVARALAEQVGVGEEQPFRMLLGGLQAREDLRVVQPLGVVPQVGALVERGAELGEGPALDQAHLGLGDVAARELLQQLERRHRLRDLVAAGLDVAHLAHRARQRLELVAPDLDAGLFELLHGGAEAGAARNLDLDRVAGDLDRRADVPEAVADRRGDADHNQREKGFKQKMRRVGAVKSHSTMECARLNRYGLLSVTGADARGFLHAQLTNDISKLPADRSALAGWCTAKGRLLATMLVIPSPDGFLLQLARDLAPAVAKRLSMFILRSKVRSRTKRRLGAVRRVEGTARGHLGRRQRKRSGGQPAPPEIGKGLSLDCSRKEQDWTLEEIRAGRPWISAATQDQFVPQMVNLEQIGGVDFQKGCYPGQEIVARAQYRGEVKRRMVRVQAPAAPSSSRARISTAAWWWTARRVKPSP
jgi:folate-binding protein YgfZ